MSVDEHIRSHCETRSDRPEQSRIMPLLEGGKVPSVTHTRGMERGYSDRFHPFVGSSVCLTVQSFFHAITEKKTQTTVTISDTCDNSKAP